MWKQSISMAAYLLKRLKRVHVRHTSHHTCVSDFVDFRKHAQTLSEIGPTLSHSGGTYSSSTQGVWDGGGMREILGIADEKRKG